MIHKFPRDRSPDGHIFGKQSCQSGQCDPDERKNLKSGQLLMGFIAHDMNNVEDIITESQRHS